MSARSASARVRNGRLGTEQARIGLREQPRIVIRDAAEHHAIDVASSRSMARHASMPPLMTIVQLGKLALQPVHDVVAQRRHFAVLLRRQALQHGIARMHDEHVAAAPRDGADEVAHEAVVLVVVEADAVLDRDRDRAPRRASPARNRATSAGSAIRHAPKLPVCTRSDGQPQLRLISS